MGSAELELSLRTRAGGYSLGARLALDPALAPAALIAGEPPVVALDRAALQALAHDPPAYGRALATALFDDPRAAAALAVARAQAAAVGQPLRLRLRLDAADAALHELFWETLCDPDGAALARSERLLLARTLDSDSAAPLALGPRDAARALVAVAAPDGLAAYGLAPLDAATELARARAALGPLPHTLLARAAGAAASLSALLAALRDGPTILFLVCHGTRHEDMPFLWLEDEAGAIARVAAAELADAVSRLARPPALALLSSCHGAGALAALGPRLASAGVPAVIAMQGAAPVETAAAFAASFFGELWRDGEVDRAVAAGRAAIPDERSWWLPVLYQRIRDGRIWREPATAPAGVSVQVGGNVYGQLIVNTGTITQLTPQRLSSLHQLRPPLDDFVGRAAELDALRTALRPRADAPAVAAICGMGGLGKSELALRAAHELRASYPDAQLFVSMRAFSGEGVRGPAAALGNLIRSFDANAALPDDLDALVDLYLGHLSGTRALVILDDAPDSAAARQFIPPAGCALLITSRSRIWLKGQGKTLSLGLLSRDEARALLLNDAPELADSPELEAILARCGDLPLALRVAAAALADGQLSPARYLERLGDEARRLRALRYDDVDVAAVLGTSEELLAADEPALARRWRMLGVCVAPFEAAAAGAIWNEPDVDALESDLEVLLRRSLLGFDAAARCYRMHDLLRDLAAARRAPEDDALARRRHAAHYLGVYQQAQRLYQAGHDEQLRGLRLYDAAEEQIHAAARWATAAATPEADQLLLAAVESSALVDLRLTPREQIAWFGGVLAAARRQGDRVEEARLLIWLGDAHHALGQLGEAERNMQQALDAARGLTDSRSALRALIGLGRVLIDRGAFAEAVPHYQEAIALARAARDRAGECRALINLATAQVQLGELAPAEGSYGVALALARELGERSLECLALSNLAGVAAANDRDDEAQTLYAQSLALAQAIGDRDTEALSLWSQGELLLKRGRATEALPLMERAVAIERELGSPLAEADAATVAELRRSTAPQE